MSAYKFQITKLFFQGYTPEEISNKLNISKSEVEEVYFTLNSRSPHWNID